MCTKQKQYLGTPGAQLGTSSGWQSPTKGDSRLTPGQHPVSQVVRPAAPGPPRWNMPCALLTTPPETASPAAQRPCASWLRQKTACTQCLWRVSTRSSDCHVYLLLWILDSQEGFRDSRGPLTLDVSVSQCESPRCIPELSASHSAGLSCSGVRLASPTAGSEGRWLACGGPGPSFWSH